MRRVPLVPLCATLFAAGVPRKALHPQQGKALIAYLASAAARDRVRASGLDPK